MQKIAVLVGSLRRESINLKLARVLAKLGHDKFEFNIVNLHDVPMYNEDLWENPPASVLQMKKDVESADGVVLITPEYNRTFSPVIKNALDWGSRPWGQSSWAGKPTSILGASPGAIGTGMAQSDLRNVAIVLDMIVMGQPEVYLQFKPEAYDDQDNVTDARTKEFLEGYLNKFDAWIKQTSKK